MVFTVISLADNVDPAHLKGTLEASPEFVESETGYPEMLAQAGWSVLEIQDISNAYAASSTRQIEAMRKNRDAVVGIVGAEEFDFRVKKYTAKITALNKGRLRRELFVTEAA
jgi:hypothetical protein